MSYVAVIVVALMIFVSIMQFNACNVQDDAMTQEEFEKEWEE